MHASVHPTARLESSAVLAGDVTVGPRAYVGHGVVIESAGPPVEVGPEALVLAGAVVRSVGGRSRPASPVRIGERSLVSPACVLTGCRVGRGCYVATGAIVLQGAVIGDHARIGAGAIVHARTKVPAGARVGMRHVAVPTDDGFVSTADVEVARAAVAELDFFDVAFGAGEDDQAALHERVVAQLLDEVHAMPR
jgi:carbonic anhydrase/acetyltransferase-like protein (isoleucine patch superfamily)